MKRVMKKLLASLAIKDPLENEFTLISDQKVTLDISLRYRVLFINYWRK